MAESKSQPKWNLLVPFITAPEFPLKETQAVTIGDIHAQLRPHAFDYSILLIEDLESAQVAHELFRSLRIGLLAASLNISWGIRVRDKVDILDQDSPMPNELDVPLIYPEGRNLSRLLVHVGPVQKQVGKVLPRLLQSVEFGMKSASAGQAIANDHVKLALELYVDSYFETSDSARFLGLVTALEVLKGKDNSSDAACDLVDRWSAQASEELNTVEAASIKGSLKYLKRISIARGIGSVVRRHIGEDRMKEARDLYMARSSLVHDGIRPDDFSDIVTRTQTLVRELLIRILQSGSL